MLKIGIITGSTRPNRKSLDVAKWVLEIARKRSDAQYELVDIKEFELPNAESRPRRAIRASCHRG